MPEGPEKLNLDSVSPDKLKLEALKALIPGIFGDGVIDAQKLSAEVGYPVIGAVDSEEGFGLAWAGKREAVIATNMPTLASLNPLKDESINWDSAQNVFIEGDNLEVLKLLQKAYNDQIKLIYIDPPYNTGNDFVYNDDFSDPAKHYLKVTGQVDDEGNKIRANTETSGRKSSNWLSMMYPRIQLARNLLTEDGTIFVSIDDNEVAHLRELLDDVFGPENFLGQFIWSAGRKNDAKYISTSHEYILVYARNISSLNANVGVWRKKKNGLTEIYEIVDKLRKENGSDFDAMTSKLKLWYKNLDESNPSKKNKHYNNIDEIGVYFPDNISWPGGGGPKFEVLHPVTGKPVKVPSRGWMYSSPERMQEMIALNKVHFGPDENSVPCIKRYLTETENEVPYSVFYVDGRGASKRLRELLGKDYFDFPKDELVLQEIIEFASDKNATVLDFFAGSGTTGHSVILQNAKDGGNRKFVLVNMPEPTNEKSVAFQDGIKTVSEITRLRLNKVIEQFPQAKSQGLRCLKLAGSNFLVHELNSNSDQLILEESSLNGPVNIENLATEILLKNGVRLDAEWARPNEFDGKVVIAASVAVVATLDVRNETLETLIETHKIHTVIFLEDAFISKDDLKANLYFRCKNSNVTMKTV